ncbi:HAD family hydrolase [Haloarcula sp. CBA1130]|uniref:HAD family hydrolase n=1 Tax=unclassified Haloarcula TaxID=2624677 RepID=UPI001243DFA7|nr:MULTISPECIES: HAD family hydrolase [unclassified Haloarcula]KAA9399547.1 HAD family hydrolase [Haloarcula sp. CBA1129]KAA9401271.1 HAD family hydrolase [Haloarcula sp. CBA1130]
MDLDMEQYDQLYRLYKSVDTTTLRGYQEFVDLFPPLSSTVALEQWETASDRLDDLKADITAEFSGTGETYAEIAARLTRDEAFTALDLYSKYDRSVNVLVLDVDETLRSAGDTDNEIPRDTLYLLTQFHEAGVPIVVCTGQTLENVKGFMIQGLGNDLVSSGQMSIVYESGNGVFTPKHGEDTKRLLYERLDDAVVDVFETVRRRVLSEAPDAVGKRCHLQGNEFNVTLKPNAEVGSDNAVEIIDESLRYLCGLVGDAIATQVDAAVDDPAGYARAYFSRDPEILDVLESGGLSTDADIDDAPEAFRAILERVDLGYYEGDAAELVSLELDKSAGVEEAFDVLGIDDPFALVMGDSKSDLRVMRWVDEHDAGIAAAPAHSSPDVLDHVSSKDDLVYEAGDASTVLRTIYGISLVEQLDERGE